MFSGRFLDSCTTADICTFPVHLVMCSHVPGLYLQDAHISIPMWQWKTLYCWCVCVLRETPERSTDWPQDKTIVSFHLSFHFPIACSSYLCLLPSWEACWSCGHIFLPIAMTPSPTLEEVFVTDFQIAFICFKPELIFIFESGITEENEMNE